MQSIKPEEIQCHVTSSELTSPGDISNEDDDEERFQVRNSPRTMKQRANITRGLTRVLALVLTLVFALSTFHGHADASSGHEETVTIGIGLDDATSEKAPGEKELFDLSGCSICSLHAQILGTAPTELVVGLVMVAERYTRFSETGRIRPQDELHRPPINAAE